MKNIRIACGAGFSGDRIEPALDIIKQGNISYMIFECLAERTIALAQKDKLANASTGYNPLLTYRMEKVIPLLKHNPTKIITNMGAANPKAAAQKIHEIAKANGLDLKIAAIEGDDISSKIKTYTSLPIMETGDALSSLHEHIVSANAYIGGQAISQALAQGADIVVTGRVADPALVAGAIMHEFQQDYNNYDFLGKCILAGHLLECAGQVTGGYFADPGIKDVPDLWNLGFPILTFHQDGSLILEKLANTGGLISTSTVKEQLLYEVQDPANYITPDVVADFSKVIIEEQGHNKVKIYGATGKPPTGTLKVSVGYLDGWIGEGEISYGGHNAKARAKLAADVICRRLEMTGVKYKEIRVDMLGVDSLYGKAHTALYEPIEVRLRVSARVNTKEDAEKIGIEVEALYTNGPAGGGGARKYANEVVAVASVLVPQEDIVQTINWKGGK